MKITVKNLIRTALLGIALTFSGGYTNMFVVHHNEDKMPVWIINETVAVSLVNDPEHSALTKDSNYKVLCDIFVIPTITPKGLEYGDIMSLGDLFIFTGESFVCLSQILLVFWIPFKYIRKAFSWIHERVGINVLLK